MTAEKQREWVEVLALFSGCGFHPPVTGVLTSISAFRADGKRNYDYTFRRKDGTLFSFGAVHGLDHIIQEHHAGHWMCVKLNAEYSWPQILVWTSREKQWMGVPRPSSSRDLGGVLRIPTPAPFRPTPFTPALVRENPEKIKEKKQRIAELLRRYGTCGICGTRRDLCCC
jgi:hypothetical protein